MLPRTPFRAALGLLLAAGLAACGGSGQAEAAPNDGARAQAEAAPAQGPAAENVKLAAAGTGPLVTVYKSPSCGCCRKWVEHMEANGFRVEVHDVDDIMPAKREAGVPEHLGSCHTARVEGFAVEGHVPADVIQRLLRERPQVAGIAVPGMPMGSPGMEGPRTDPYDIIAFTKDGKTEVYESR
ncbi:MAG TPA: DUF411 domain-containing protein [Longimicrobium sp.]|nr:DUF411 domain-containing protein [Longimicrobium sp.]